MERRCEPSRESDDKSNGISIQQLKHKSHIGVSLVTEESDKCDAGLSRSCGGECGLHPGGFHPADNNEGYQITCQHGPPDVRPLLT